MSNVPWRYLNDEYWPCMYTIKCCTFFGIVFILFPYLIVCALAYFSDLKQGNQSLLDLNHFRDLTLVSMNIDLVCTLSNKFLDRFYNTNIYTGWYIACVHIFRRIFMVLGLQKQLGFCFYDIWFNVHLYIQKKCSK
jgi:hypothetical protein